jgi:predicted translin family RNA/ssDNA-binding protein
MSEVPEAYAAATQIMNASRSAPSAADELGHFLSARAAYDALEQAVHELGRIAGKEYDVVVKAFDITIAQIEYVEPYTLIFRGLNKKGQHAFVLCHFSQLVAHFAFAAKAGANREPIGFSPGRSRQ